MAEWSMAVRRRAVDEFVAEHFHPDDPRISELIEELALTESSIAAYLVQRQAGDATAPNWKDACEAKDTFKRARDSKDLKATQRKLPSRKCLADRPPGLAGVS
jgi:hypothetical protein